MSALDTQRFGGASVGGGGGGGGGSGGKDSARDSGKSGAMPMIQRAMSEKVPSASFLPGGRGAGVGLSEYLGQVRGQEWSEGHVS